MSNWKELKTGAGLALGAFITYTAAGAQYSRNFLPTPEEYYLSTGVKAEPEIISLLKQFDDVRIVPSDTREESIYCAFNIGACGTTTNATGYEISLDRAVTPHAYKRWLGAPTSIRITSFGQGYAQADTKLMFQKELKNPEIADLPAFSSTFFHELGHVYADRVGVSPFLFDPDGEITADLFSAGALRTQFGKAAVDMTVA